MRNAKTIYIVGEQTFSINLVNQDVTISDCDLVDIVCKLDDYRVVTDNQKFADKLSKYLLTTVEVVSINDIASRNWRGFIATPPVMGYDWKWKKVLSVSVAQQVANILSLRGMMQVA
jgi:hypothetical protein